MTKMQSGQRPVRHRFRSLTARFLIIYLLAVMLSIVVFFAALEARTYLHDNDELVDRLQELIKLERLPFARALWEFDNERIDELVAGLDRLPQLQSAVVFDSSDRVLAQAGDPDLAIEHPALHAETELTIEQGGRAEKVGRLTITFERDVIRQRLMDRVLVDLLIMLVLALTLVAVTRFATARYIGAPLSRLRASIERSRRDDTHEPVVWDSRDEIGQLVIAYNELQQAQQVVEQDLLRARSGLELQVETRTRELDERRALLRTALDNMPGGIMMVDAEQRVRVFNDRLREMMSLSDEVLYPGCELREMLAYRAQRGDLGEGDADELVTRRLRELEAGLGSRVEEIMPDGRVLEVFRAPTGDGGVVLVASDVSERKAAEAALVKSEKLINAVLENSPAVIYLKDLQGRYLMVNHSWTEVSGISAERTHLATDFDLLPATVAEQFVANDRKVVASNAPVQIEEQLPQADGELHTYISYKFPVSDANGTVFAVGGISTDITDLKQLQEQLESARDAAEQASRAKSDFLANMSHEIRTPMNAIIGMSHLALRTDLSAKQRNYIEKVNRSAESLLGIINDILDFSKIEAGKLDMEQVEFQLEDVLDNLASVLGLKAEDKGLELLFDIAPDLPTALVGDPLRLGQILINLGNNAVKFTDNGEVVLSARLLSGDQRQAEIEFSLRDSGIGMTAEQQSRLFESFSQADTSITRRFGGTGLGLTISKRLTEMMGGTISVQSQAGAGSTFTFNAHFGVQQGSGRQRSRKPDRDLGGLRVLVIDDNASAREIMSEMLTSFGFEVGLARSGSEGLACLAAADGEGKPYRIAMTDWRMPGLDGVETTRRIAEDATIVNKPSVIMVTAYGREEAVAAAAGVSPAAVLAKPVAMSVLLDTIAEIEGVEIGHQSRQVVRQERHTTVAAKLRGARLLLVEDNEINQELATELLTSAGISVALAANGEEALQALDVEPFDGVLMDVNMPVMDGYTATARIREQSRFSALPIIAMTANAMAGDREKCVAAGMNDHISKPIRVREMFATLDRWIRPAQTAPADGDAQALAPPTDIVIPALDGIDVEQGLDRVLGNRGLYLRLLGKYRDSQQAFEAQFRVALQQHDLELATRLAHTLKGVSGNIGADAVRRAAEVLERSCRENSGPEHLQAQLRSVVQALNPVLVALAALEQTDEAVETKVAPLDIAALTPALSKLAGLLGDYDGDAVDALQELSAEFPGQLPRAALKRVQNLVDAYEFEPALEALRQMAGELGIELS